MTQDTKSQPSPASARRTRALRSAQMAQGLLTYDLLTLHRDTIYQPRHWRLVVQESQGDVYQGLLFDADWALILSVEAPTATEAELTLGRAADIYFRLDAGRPVFWYGAPVEASEALQRLREISRVETRAGVAA